ncbi:MAG: wax ester/triacylglycerol synthase family O-acyltransferase, partial [Proteobacteria bacterium]
REPLELADAARRALAAPAQAVRGARDALVGLGESLAALRPASPTPLNPEHVGPHRRVDWLRFDLEEVKRVRRHLGGTLNDVVLATVAGALRRYLRAHRVDLRGLAFRVMCPVSVRAADASGALGNRVVMLVVELPLAERDPRRRLARVVETTAALKQSKSAQGSELIETVADWTTTSLVTETMRLATRLRVFNLIVTNVPGPQLPLYLLGAPIVATHPLVPLYANQGAGIALLSYAGGLFWGLTGDWDRVADLHELTSALGDSFDELRKAASEGARAATPRRRRASTAR